MIDAVPFRPQRAVTPVVFGGLTAPSFCFLEEGQTVLVGPSGVAELGPQVEIRGVAPDVDHSIDRARSTEGFAAGAIENSSMKARLRYAVVAPVELAGTHQLEVTGGHPHKNAVARPAGLEEEDAVARILRETARHYAAGRSRADHHIIVDPIHACSSAGSVTLSKKEMSRLTCREITPAPPAILHPR